MNDARIPVHRTALTRFGAVRAVLRRPGTRLAMNVTCSWGGESAKGWLSHGAALASIAETFPRERLRLCSSASAHLGKGPHAVSQPP